MALAKCRECGHESRPVRKRSIVTKIVLGFVGVVLISGLVGGLGSDAPGTAGSGSHATEPQKSPKAIAMEAVSIEKVDWRTGGFDTVMLLSGKINNKGKSDVKDVRIKCELYSNSGTQVSEVSAVIYEIVKAGKSISLKDHNMGFVNTQSSRAGCSVVDLTVI